METLEWTDTGLVALRKEREALARSLRDVAEDELRASIARTVARYAPAWGRGATRADDAGRAAIEIASTLDPTRPLSVEHAAGVLSLLRSRSDGDAGPLTELLLRRDGWTFVLRTLSAMWSMKTDYHDPGWPADETQLAIWVRAIVAEDSAAQDASVSHGKASVAHYLHERLREAPESERVQAREALAAVWSDTPLHARGALAYAVDDRERAEEITRDLIANRTPSYPHFPAKVLPLVVRDPELLGQMRRDDAVVMSLRFLAAHGGNALPFYERKLAERINAQLRVRYVGQLANLRGPRTAALVASHAAKAPFKKLVAAYFARFPELAGAAPAPSTVATPKKSARRGR